MVLFIVTLLLGSILVPLQTQVETRKIDGTQRILDQAREALLGFTAANGRFPCPASATSNGLESFAAGGNATNGNCSNFFNGFLPAATLGFTPTDAQGYALDAWGLPANRIRYAVSNATVTNPGPPSVPVTNPLTRRFGMRDAGMSNIASSATLLYVCNSGTGVSGSNCNTAVTLASSVPVVLLSLGPNAATGGTSTDEAENLDGDRIFVSKLRSSTAGAEFDDIVTWIGSPMLFNRLIAAGQLP